MLDRMQNNDLAVVPKDASMLQCIQNTLEAVVDISPAFVRWKNIDMNIQRAHQWFDASGYHDPPNLVAEGSSILR